jgi:hypothetical protein
VPRQRPWTARPTISVVCPAAHPGPLVAEVLRQVREVVDEVVIAADARVDAADLGHYATVADVLLRFEFDRYDAHWSWLASQAHGDWLLELDGDEVASAALISALRELVADRCVRQYSLPVHWPWPDSSHYLADEPWSSGRRLRLLRNDDRLAFVGRIHYHAELDPPVRYLNELPVYHIDLLLPDLARREAKVASYDAEHFGLLTAEGFAFNEAFYLPERTGEHTTTTMPKEDAKAIERALSATYEPSLTLDPGNLPLHRREEILLHVPLSDLPDDAYRGKLALASPLPRFSAGRPEHELWLRVENKGTARWPGGESREPQVRIGVTWQPVGGGERIDVGRAFLPHALGPGEEALVPVNVCAPPTQGLAELVLDLVHEDVRWFECPVRVQVEIGPSARERLATLTREHGQLIPVAEAVRLRREMVGRDCLLREISTEALPSDRRLARVMREVDLGERNVDAAVVDRLAELIRMKRPAKAVEFACGASTIALASLLAERRDRNASQLISFEHDPRWISRVQEELARRGLERAVSIARLPLEPSDGKRPAGYLRSDEAAALLDRHPPELIFVSGPVIDPLASRVGAVDIVAPFLRREATLLLDGAFSDAGLCVAQAWERRGDASIQGIRPTAEGLLEATLSASA